MDGGRAVSRVTAGAGRSDGTYVPGLDGLRALAVLAVVAYHLRLGWARGGFIGVDLFFVLSGFLITGVLLREADGAGRIRLLRFWRRRLQRLAPALVLVVAATAVASRMLLDPNRWPRVRADSFASLFYTANWSFISEQLSYFERLLPPSPLRHTWSLAIEEQFYLVWPVLVAACCRLRRGRRAGAVAAVVAVLIGASIVSMHAYAASATRAYFGTDARAHELLIGAVLAVVVRSGLGRRLVAPAGRWLLPPVLLAYGVGFVLLRDSSSSLYRGWLTAYAVLGGLAVLAASSTAPAGLLRLLAMRPLAWVGRRSYSIYLWHWPVIVIVEGSHRIAGRPQQVVVILGLTLVLADLTHRMVETPYRSMLPSPRLALIAVASLAGCAAVVTTALGPGSRHAAASVLRPDVDLSAPGAVGAVGALGSTLPSTPVTPAPETPTPESRPATTGATSVTTTLPTAGGLPIEVGAGTAVVPTTAAPTAAVPTSAAPTPAGPQPATVLLLGDSTAFKLADEIGRQDLDRDVLLQAYATLGCSLSPGKPVDVHSEQQILQAEHCARWQTEWAAAVHAVQADAVVIMVGAWEVFDHVVDGQRISFGTRAWTELETTALTSAVEVAGAGGAPVFVLRLPCMVSDPQATFPGRVRAEPARLGAINAIWTEIAGTHPNVHLLGLDQLLCPDGVPLIDDGTARIRYDGVHLTAAGSSMVWSWLQAQLAAAGVT